MHCNSTAPRPKEASADTFDLAVVSYSAITIIFVNSCLSALKARSCSGPWSHAHMSLSSSRRGLLILAMFGKNFPTIPMNLCKSDTYCKTVIRQIAAVFSRSAQTPSLSITQLRNFKEGLLSSHFAAFNVTPADCTRFRTLISLAVVLLLISPENQNIIHKTNYPI